MTTTMSDPDIFGDDIFGTSSTCNPITQEELEEAESFDALADDAKIDLFERIEESREGNARTKTEEPITDDRPVILLSETFSMHRLLWVDGTRVVHNTDKDGTTVSTPTKATFAVFKMHFDSRTKSSGTGTDRAVQYARVQVELHGAGPEASQPGAQRPRVIGWAPFATMAQANETTAQHTNDKSASLSLTGGVPQAGGTIEGRNSTTTAFKRRFFEKYYSRPVSVSGSTTKRTAKPHDKGRDYNGVSWIMEQNSLAREGIVSELLMYLLFTRQDDSEYSVKITARVGTHGLRNFGHNPEHKCVLRVTPREPDGENPAVCSFEGEKMLSMLDVNRFEKLLSSRMDAGLDLPWEKKEGAEDAKNGTPGTNTEAGADGTGSGNNKAPVGGVGNENNQEKQNRQDESKNCAKVEPNATLTTVAAPLPDMVPVELKPTMQAEKRNVHILTPPLDDKGLLASAVSDALRGLPGGVAGGRDNGDYNMATNVAMLESRIEVLEYQVARQALVIRTLLNRQNQ
ncbi:hypothetical protein SPI_07723 [Niveomyces insectorum RCEF 264]|uniref:Uncharacterized protein n=1 Tax=Niveomyces insectorum RCEF 264 TaxID=1081102 RepID=A0A167PJ83_9HYPO|nr:hypothetical protein SPI_07723 [Niveomyces insectorum RCEF 264]